MDHMPNIFHEVAMPVAIKSCTLDSAQLIIAGRLSRRRSTRGAATPGRDGILGRVNHMTTGVEEPTREIMLDLALFSTFSLNLMLALI